MTGQTRFGHVTFPRSRASEVPESRFVTPKGSKLDAQAKQAHWIGFDADSTHAHRVYWVGLNKVTVKCNVKFVPTTVVIQMPALLSYAQATGQAGPQAAATPPAPPALQAPAVIPQVPALLLQAAGAPALPQ